MLAIILPAVLELYSFSKVIDIPGGFIASSSTDPTS
jgi:hypothetical protein